MADGIDKINAYLLKTEKYLAPTINMDHRGNTNCLEHWSHGRTTKEGRRDKLQQLERGNATSKILSRVIINSVFKTDPLPRKEQVGFRKVRSCADQIFTLRQNN